MRSSIKYKRLHATLRKIAERRPAHDDAATAFYRCRQDAREALASVPVGGVYETPDDRSVDLLRRTLQMAQSSLHRACLALGSTEGYREDFQEISEVLKRTAPGSVAAGSDLSCTHCGSEHPGPKDAHCDRRRGSYGRGPNERPWIGSDGRAT